MVQLREMVLLSIVSQLEPIFFIKGNAMNKVKLPIYIPLLLIMIIVVAVSFVSFNFIKTSKTVSAVSSAEESDASENVYDKIDSYLAETVKAAHIPALSITMVDKDGVVFSNSYGECKSTETPFLLGSVTKSFTAACIMQLKEQDILNLDDKMSKFLPDYKYSDDITIRQLLNHTSGLGEHHNLTNYKIVGKQGEHVYSNVNYSLLGKIIEAASGVSYQEYVTKNIFGPLGMSNSSASIDGSLNKGLIQGYRNWFGINVPTKPQYSEADDAWITLPAGYLSASTDDLGKYLRMYLSGGYDVLSEDSIRQMFYDGVEVEADIPYRYGMGWNYIKDPLPEHILRHSGLVETGMSVIYVLPERGLAYAIAINTNDYFVGKDFMDRLDWSVALMLMGERYNVIKPAEFGGFHTLYDLAYIIVFAISLLPLCLMGLYYKRINKGRFGTRIILLLLLHLVLPVILLLFPLMLSTPLWVVQAFVPDLFLTLVLSACLLFSGGIVKAVLIVLNKRKAIKN